MSISRCRVAFARMSLAAAIGAAVSFAGAPAAQEPGAEFPPGAGPPPASGAAVPSPLPIGTMSELMVKIIYPASDAILYISTRTPTNEEEWNELEGKALILAESANLLMMPSRVMAPVEQWIKDSQLMLDAGAAAFEAARNRDVAALEELNQAVYDSCVVCHLHYRPDYGKSK